MPAGRSALSTDSTGFQTDSTESMLAACQTRIERVSLCLAAGTESPEPARASREAGGTEARGDGAAAQRAHVSSCEKKYPISYAAVSDPSEPCTAFDSMDVARSFRIVPAA